MIYALGLVLVSYLLGSVSAAVVVCKLLGKNDPRESGSGNPGATNVLRLHGKGPAIATLLGDIGKGVVPVLLARWLDLGPLIIGACACAAFLGHLFPIFFGFRGGKGVATFVGVLLAISPAVGLSFVGLWLLMAAITRYSSLAALTATAAMPLVGLALDSPWPYVAAMTVMGGAIFYRHQANISRLLAGTEGRIGKR